MDVISDCRAVGCRVVGAEHHEIGDVALNGHHRSRDQMRLGIAQLADLPFGVGATRIEIPKRDYIDVVGAGVIAEDALYHRLRGAVGVDGLLRRVLADGVCGRLAVDGA